MSTSGQTLIYISGEVGFLADKRRINVAVTRARRHLAVICDTETVKTDPFLKSLIDYMEDAGQVWSAQQFIQGILSYFTINGIMTSLSSLSRCWIFTLNNQISL